VNPAASSKEPTFGGQGEVEPGEYGRRPWKVSRTWKATPKNLPGYGERHVQKVVNGTGDTLLVTSFGSKAETYKCKRSGGWTRGSRRGS
jgi:hypothetical protein